MLLYYPIPLPVFLELLHVFKQVQAARYIASSLYLILPISNAGFLRLEVLEFLQLRPDEVGLFYSLRDCEPVPPRDERPHHRGVIALSHVDLEPMLVLQWWLHE